MYLLQMVELGPWWVNLQKQTHSIMCQKIGEHNQEIKSVSLIESNNLFFKNK